MAPLVSILIPAYNSERWIAETIRSAIAQDCEKEIIVVDDGSTDRTLEIARSFESEGVKVFSQPNRGASAARNKAFSLCIGEYIQWLDADDLLAPDKISKQLIGARDKRELISSPWAKFIYAPAKAKFTKDPWLWCDLPVVEFFVRKLSNNLYFPTVVWLVSRELTEAAGPWDESLSLDDDGEYFCRVMMASSGIRFAPLAKCYYRQSISGLSHAGNSIKKMESQARSLRLLVEYVLAIENSERSRHATVLYLQTWVSLFRPCRMDIVRELQQLAVELGGEIAPKPLPRKLAWINSLFGWSATMGAQKLVGRAKWEVACFRDRMSVA